MAEVLRRVAEVLRRVAAGEGEDSTCNNGVIAKLCRSQATCRKPVVLPSSYQLAS